MNWQKIINTLMLVRLGQELGTDSPLARLVAEWIDVLCDLSVWTMLR
jgi:hypothetical protein